MQSNTDGYKDTGSIVINHQSIKRSNRFVGVTGCIIGIMFAGLFGYMIYKNNFPIESILSVLLAFFSIFIAVFFYFKADEANSRFYYSSYNFMKDVSVTLGKIEERFGEKLNTLNEKLTNIEHERTETKIELESAEDEKDKIINDLLKKANMSEEEKTRYKKELLEKEAETQILRRRLYEIENDNFRIKRMQEAENNSHSHRFISSLAADIKNQLLAGERVNFSDELKSIGVRADIIYPDGRLTPRGVRLLSNTK